MNAPFVWIIFPVLLSFLLLSLRRWQTVVNWLGTFFSFFLSVMALVTPINQAIKPGLVQFSLLSDWIILGRTFSINQVDLPFISFLYFMATTWFFISWESKKRSLFIPLGLGITAILIAALSVRPFIYAALLIEASVLGCVLMLIDSPQPVGRGAIRFLILQSLGMPFILLAGWFLASGEITPINQTQLTLSVILLVLGFAFWIGLFPLHTWVPMVTEESEPLVAGFIFSILPLAVIFFLLDFMNSYAWLREYPLIYPVLRWLGSFMVLFAGIWAFFQKQLKQVFGYLMIALNGLSLLVIGIKGGSGISLLTYLFLPRFLIIVLFALTLHILGEKGLSTEVENLKSLAESASFSAMALLLAVFSFSGLPMLPGFPLIQIVIAELVGLSYLALVLFLAGLLLFLLFGLKLLSLVFMKTAGTENTSESLLNRSLFGIAFLVLLFTGLFPGVVTTLFFNLADKFPLLIR